MVVVRSRVGGEEGGGNRERGVEEFVTTEQFV